MTIDWDKVREEAVGVLSRYLKADTSNPPGKETAGARVLQQVLEKEGLAATILESQPERGNLVCTTKGKDGLSP
jgi:hypothetical protein